MKDLRFGSSARGFDFVEFRDAYGLECSIQCSSAIGDHEDAMDTPGSSFLWIGVDDPEPKVMCSMAESLGVEKKGDSGWQPYPIPGDVLISSRMHVSREGVEKMVELLNGWLDSGRLIDAD